MAAPAPGFDGELRSVSFEIAASRPPQTTKAEALAAQKLTQALQ